MPYLYKSIMNDLGRLPPIRGGHRGVEELRDEDAEPTENQAPPVPDLLEADFVEAGARCCSRPADVWRTPPPKRR